MTTFEGLKSIYRLDDSEMEKPIEECGIQNDERGRENGREGQAGGRRRRNVRCRVSRSTNFLNNLNKNVYAQKQHNTENNI